VLLINYPNYGRGAVRRSGLQNWRPLSSGGTGWSRAGSPLEGDSWRRGWRGWGWGWGRGRRRGRWEVAAVDGVGILINFHAQHFDVINTLGPRVPRTHLKPLTKWRRICLITRLIRSRQPTSAVANTRVRTSKGKLISNVAEPQHLRYRSTFICLKFDRNLWATRMEIEIGQPVCAVGEVA